MPKQALLVATSHPVQQSIIEKALRNEGIQYSIRESSSPNVILGQADPMHYVEFYVPAEQLQDAKDLLCASDIVCDVSERLLSRCMESLVPPLLQIRRSADRDFSRLEYFVEVNNKETVLAIYAATLEREGGQDLLEDFFFHLLANGSSAIVRLARALGSKSGVSVSDEFGRRFEAIGLSQEREPRLQLLEVAPDFAGVPWQSVVLQAALLDDDFEIRDVASESLFSATGEDGGYDPGDPPEERERVVREIFRR